MSLCAMNKSFLGPTRILNRLDWNCLVIGILVGDHYNWLGYRNSTCPWRGFKYSDVPDDGTEEMSREAVSEIDNLLIGGAEVSGGSSSGMFCKYAGSNASSTAGKESSDGPAATMGFDDPQPAPSDSQESIPLLLRFFPFFFFDETPNNWLAAPGS